MHARFAVAAVATLLWSSIAVAGIIGTTGDVVVIPPPASVVPPNLAEDGVIHVFLEQTGLMLGADVQADMTVHYTTYDPPSGRTLGLIPMGTTVSTYYIHFDPVTAGAGVGSVTFDEPILGVIAEGDEADNTFITDFPGDTLGPTNAALGALGTSYPDNAELLGIEDGPDRLTLHESTISVFFGAGSPGDRVRVVTATGGAVSCGNNMLDPGEGCDDDNDVAGDGCFACLPEVCSACTGEPSTCTEIVTCVNSDGCCAEGCTPENDDDCSAKCAASKLGCVAKKKSCFLNCYGKAAKRGEPVEPSCLAKCSGKFDACFLKVDLKGGCSNPGDAAAIEAKVDAFVTDVVSDLDAAPPDDESKCRQKKLKCVDKYDACVLGLMGKAAKNQTEINPVDKAKKCDKRFNGGVNGVTSGCFGRLEDGGACETTGDTFDIQNKDDAFLEDLKCELGLCP